MRNTDEYRTVEDLGEGVLRTRRSSRVPIPWLEQLLPTVEAQREYARERCVVTITEAVGEAMERAGLTRSEMATRLGVTKGHVSNVLSGARNMTLHTLGDLLWACDRELDDLKTSGFGIAKVPLPCAFEWYQSQEYKSLNASKQYFVVNPTQLLPREAPAAANINLALAA